ncbi:MAG: non-canonical purine NTP pyrophosphatase, partial [Lachnospiraceae bacterium]|nr:non-canonical purine NTP pyrophosphatase [Lachnospiraceae bacterium]
MFQIVFATGNQGKMREIRAILRDCEAKIISMKEAGLDIEIEENGTT